MDTADIFDQLAASITADLTRHGIDCDLDEATVLAEEVLARLTMKRLLESTGLPPALEEAGAAALIAANEHYISTACIHLRHDTCRRQCKYCDHECRCPCHEGKPHPGPRTERYTLTAGADAAQNYNIDEALALARYYLFTGRDVHLAEYKPGA